MFEKPPIKGNNPEKPSEEKWENNILLEKIEIIENIPVYPDEKVELLLVASGDKSATEIELFSDTWIKKQGESPKNVDIEKISKIKKALDDFGFTSSTHSEIDEVITVEDDNISAEEIRPEDEIHKEREKVTITVSKSEDVRKELEVADKNADDLKMGKLYGFPETAIEEYLKGEGAELMLRKDLPDAIKKENWTLFATFSLSKSNWEKELETAKRWAETVEKNSPKIYNEYVKFARGMDNFN